MLLHQLLKSWTKYTTPHYAFIGYSYYQHNSFLNGIYNLINHIFIYKVVGTIIVNKNYKVLILIIFFKFSLYYEHNYQQMYLEISHTHPLNVH